MSATYPSTTHPDRRGDTQMYIQNENAATRELKDERVAALNDGKPVDFDGEGNARVRKEVGEYLSEAYETISARDREDSVDDVEVDAAVDADSDEGGDD